MSLMTKPKPRSESSGEVAPRKPNRKGKPLSIWLDPVLRDAIDQLAEKNRRPLTTEVAIALEKHLRESGLWPSR